MKYTLNPDFNNSSTSINENKLFTAPSKQRVRNIYLCYMLKQCPLLLSTLFEERKNLS